MSRRACFPRWRRRVMGRLGGLSGGLLELGWGVDVDVEGLLGWL